MGDAISYFGIANILIPVIGLGLSEMMSRRMSKSALDGIKKCEARVAMEVQGVFKSIAEHYHRESQGILERAVKNIAARELFKKSALDSTELIVNLADDDRILGFEMGSYDAEVGGASTILLSKTYREVRGDNRLVLRLERMILRGKFIRWVFGSLFVTALIGNLGNSVELWQMTDILEKPLTLAIGLLITGWVVHLIRANDLLEEVESKYEV